MCVYMSCTARHLWGKGGAKIAEIAACHTTEAESPTHFAVEVLSSLCKTDLREAMSSRRALAGLLLQGARNRAAWGTAAGAGTLQPGSQTSAFNDVIRAASFRPDFADLSEQRTDQDVVATRKKVVDLLAPYQRAGVFGAAAGVGSPVFMNELMAGFSRAHGFSSFAAAGELSRERSDVMKGLILGNDVIKGERKFKTSAIAHSKKNRPLSPHLTVYRPEMSSMSSITNRITGAFLSVLIAGGVLSLRVADTSLSFYPVYSLIFFSQQIPYWLTLSVGNFALVALAYHVIHSLRRELQQWGLIKFKV